MKRLHIAIPDYGAEGEAALLENAAPATCVAIWASLSTPVTARGLHAAWVGPEVFINIPPARRSFDGASLPKENLTCFPQPGDLVWLWFLAGAWRGLAEDLYEIGVVYAPDAILFNPTGWSPACVFGRVTRNLEGLATACRRFREDGRRDMTFSRIE